MLQFVLTNILFLSIGTVLYIVVRTLPRLEESSEEQKQTVFERIVTSDIPNKIDATLETFMGKLFRRIKVQVMRLDNYLTGRLQKMNTQDGLGRLNGNGSTRLTASGNGNGKNGNHTDFIKELNGPLEQAVKRENGTPFQK